MNARIKIEDVLERQGLTDKVLVKYLIELLEASDVILKKDAEGKSEIVGEAHLYSPAWSARAKGLELALKLKDLLKDKVEHSGNIFFELSESLKEARSRLNSYEQIPTRN